MSKISSPIIELSKSRMREFIREPEAIFWVFGFPLILTLALGFAFRAKAPERIPVGVAAGPYAQQRVAALAKSPALQPKIYEATEGQDALRRGKISILIEGNDATPVYRYDPTRPDARAARIEADDALQASAGRRNVYAAKEERVSEQG